MHIDLEPRSVHMHKTRNHSTMTMNGEPTKTSMQSITIINSECANSAWINLQNIIETLMLNMPKLYYS